MQNISFETFQSMSDIEKAKLVLHCDRDTKTKKPIKETSIYYNFLQQRKIKSQMMKKINDMFDESCLCNYDLYNSMLNDDEYLHKLEKYPYPDFMEEFLNKLYNRQRAKFSRLKKRISPILQSDCQYVQFVTFTFNNKSLKNTTRKTRRTYIQRFCKSSYIDYVANIDFGDKNGREHYHAIVCFNDKVNFEKWHNLGAIKAKKICRNKKNAKFLSQYIAKVTNHAMKDSTGDTRCICPRHIA